MPVKSAKVQAALPDHKARDFLVRQRTQVIVTPKACFQHDAIRAHMGAFGIVVAKGIQNIERLLAAAQAVSDAARPALDMLAAQLRDTQARIEEVTVRIGEMPADDPLARRLATVPGVGTISSSAFAATTPDVSAFRSGRDYAAWLGLRSVSRTDRVPARSPKSSFQRWQLRPRTRFVRERGRSVSGGSRKQETATCADCSAWAPWPGSVRGVDDGREPRAQQPTGSTGCLIASPSRWSRSPWPTAWPHDLGVDPTGGQLQGGAELKR